MANRKTGASIPARIRDFILGHPDDDALISKVKEGGIAPMYGNSLWSWTGGSGYGGMGAAAEIPAMLRDAVISSAVNLLMSTCFQLSPDERMFWTRSKYPAVVDELDRFHTKTLMQKRILTLGYNLVVWGNMPIKLLYDRNNELCEFRFIPDYNEVVPIVISGKTIGHLVGGSYHYPTEYVYAQAQYNHDLGGPLGRGAIRFGGFQNVTGAGGFVSNMSDGSFRGPGSVDVDDDMAQIENEFAIAPSYVANAVRPWRNIQIIEAALLLARLDRSNYFRIFTVPIGGSVNSKSAVEVLNYYRRLFKKARRMSWDASGMSQQGGGNEFEVVIPKTTGQGGVDITDVGGQCLRASTRIVFADGGSATAGDMYASKARYVGRPVYTCTPDGDVGTAPIAFISSLRKNTTFVRVSLEGGGSFDVTPDHPCQLRTGSFMEASKLRAGDELMPFRVKDGKVLDPGTMEYVAVPDPLTQGGPDVAKIRYVCPKCGREFVRAVRVREMEAAPRLRWCSPKCEFGTDALSWGDRGSVVSSVEPLDVVEDSYDISVAGREHCFALECGVFVHNTDVKAIKDLDNQYQRLFASLNVQPSQIGFAQGQSSNINMGASPEEAWEMRWMRTCKTTLFSVLTAVKEIDLMFLRSKGYRVDPDDWSYGTILQSQIDDRARNDALKVSIQNLKALSETFATLQLPPYNKRYMVKSVIGASLESVGVDADVLLRPATPEQAAPQPIQGGYNLTAESIREAADVMDLAGAFSPDVVSQMRQYAAGVDVRPVMSSLEYKRAVLSPAQLAGGVGILENDACEIDLDAVFGRVDEVPKAVASDSGGPGMVIDVTKCHFLVPRDMVITLKDYRMVKIDSVNSVMEVAPGTYIVEDKGDAVIILYLLVNGLFSAVVSNILYPGGVE